MAAETQERTEDDGGPVTESVPPESVPPPSDGDPWSDVTAVAVPQSRRMEVVVTARNCWKS